MLNQLERRIIQALQSLVKFFTNAPLNVDDWKWVKDENQGVRITTRRKTSEDFTEIYNYYPLIYYNNFPSSKSPKDKQDSWDTPKLIALSNNLGNAFSGHFQDELDKN
jgi:hypothetical protein